VEVVCGVLFNDLNTLRVPHIGLFWSQLREAFPATEERPLLDAVIESVVAGPASVQLELLNSPPLPRVWFIASDGESLIQIQRDRFLYNWKRTSFDDPYPSYDFIIANFEDWLGRFRSFLEDEKLGSLEFRQYELTYVNHITADNGLAAIGESAILTDHVRSNIGTRFLPEPENFNWRTVYTLPSNQGRLHVWAQTVLRPDSQRILRLDMTARGIPEDRSDTARKDWFSVAHDWITNGFADVTNATAQKDIWGRTQ
jgi:uncharacterized protein (TIGR04255 family)